MSPGATSTKAILSLPQLFQLNGVDLAMKKMRAERWPFLASSNVRMNTAKASESTGAMRRSSRNITPAQQHRPLQHLTIRHRMLRVGSSTYALSASCQKKARKNGYRVTTKG